MFTVHMDVFRRIFPLLCFWKNYTIIVSVPSWIRTKHTTLKIV